MRKQQIENAAYEVATQIRTVEESIDSALAEIAELQGKILHAQAVSRTGVATAHGAFEQLATSIQALVEARGGMVRCHAELVEAKRRVPGLRTVSFGEGEECPDDNVGFTNLRVVA